MSDHDFLTKDLEKDIVSGIIIDYFKSKCLIKNAQLFLIPLKTHDIWIILLKQKKYIISY